MPPDVIRLKTLQKDVYFSSSAEGWILSFLGGCTRRGNMYLYGAFESGCHHKLCGLLLIFSFVLFFFLYPTAVLTPRQKSCL